MGTCMYLASVPERALEAAREGALLAPSRVTAVSRGIDDYVYVEPLGWFLRFALERGLPVDPSGRMWSPPGVHDPYNVRALSENLIAAYEEATSKGPITVHAGPDDQWSRAEIRRIIGLFRHAAKRGELVLTLPSSLGIEPGLRWGPLEEARVERRALRLWEIAVGGTVALGLGLCWWRDRRLRRLRRM